MADNAAHEQHGEQVLKFSQRALELNPASDPHAHFYAASAYLKLNRPTDAEKSALKAAEIDKQNLEPRVHFLLRKSTKSTATLPWGSHSYTNISSLCPIRRTPQP